MRHVKLEKAPKFGTFVILWKIPPYALVVGNPAKITGWVYKNVGQSLNF